MDIGTPKGLSWPAVWTRTAQMLREHLDAGRAHLLTEDTVRYACIVALYEQGIPADRLAIEQRLPGLGPQARLDLLVTRAAGHMVALEFKYPREESNPAQRGASDTATVGALLNDIHRVSRIVVTERWVVQVLSRRRLRHLDGALGRIGCPSAWPATPGATLTVPGTAVALLPKTSQAQIDGWPAPDTVTVVCEYVVDLSGPLRLLAFRVAPRVTAPSS